MTTSTTAPDAGNTPSHRGGKRKGAGRPKLYSSPAKTATFALPAHLQAELGRCYQKLGALSVTHLLAQLAVEGLQSRGSKITL